MPADAGERTTHTFCRICVSLCGVAVTTSADNKVTRIEPDKDNPHTWRDFCPKGRTASDVLEHPRRILRPMRRTADGYVEATYEEAIADISTRLNAIIERDGADAVGFYHGNPGAASTATLTILGGLMEAIGTHSRFWVGSVDQNNIHVVAHEMYGSAMIALIPDVDECDFFLLIGMNPAHSGFHWLWSVPDGWGRVLTAQARGAQVVVVDPRRTATAAKADQHISIQPGQDWALLLGMLKVIFDEGLTHDDTHQLSGINDIAQLVRAADLSDLADRCGVAADVIEDIARRFALARTAFCLAHTGVSHHTTGTIGEWLVQLLNLVTGRVDRPGGRRFERGYVDTVKVFELMAPALEGTSRVRQLPAVAGHHSLAELAGEITTPGEGQVRALIINAGNPVVSGPDGSALDEALQTLDLLVAIDFVQRESHRHADWLIPAVHFLERDDLLPLTGGIQDRPFAQMGRKVVEPPDGVRPEWTVLTDIALTMGVPLFGRRGINTLIKASRWAARVLRRPNLAFDPQWFDRLLVLHGRTIKWREIADHPHGWHYREKRYGDLKRAIRTADGRVQAAPQIFLAETQRLLSTPPVTAPSDYPLTLINRRHRESMNSWLNESPRLHRRHRSNDLEIHSDDAAEIGLATGDLACVRSQTGSIVVPVVVSDDVRPGTVVCGHGWGSGVFDPRNGGKPHSYGANRNLLVSNAELDPFSQIPALSSTFVRVTTHSPG